MTEHLVHYVLQKQLLHFKLTVIYCSFSHILIAKKKLHDRKQTIQHPILLGIYNSVYILLHFWGKNVLKIIGVLNFTSFSQFPAPGIFLHSVMRLKEHFGASWCNILFVLYSESFPQYKKSAKAKIVPDWKYHLDMYLRTHVLENKVKQCIERYVT